MLNSHYAQFSVQFCMYEGFDAEPGPFNLVSGSESLVVCGVTEAHEFLSI